MRSRLTVVMFGAWLVMAARGEAAPILNPGNGHYYDLIGTEATWTTALAAADASTYAALDGYLVTITDAVEQAFLDSTYSGIRFWIAGSDAAVEGTWRWMAGPETGIAFWQSGVGTLTYANWNSGEPNNSGIENYAVDHYEGNWNDYCSTCTTNYVVEYSAVEVPGQVPEPASLTLLATGFAGLWARARRRRS